MHSAPRPITSKGFGAARDEPDPKPMFKASRFVAGGGWIVNATSCDIAKR